MSSFDCLYVSPSLADNTVYVGQSARMAPENLATYLGSGDYFRQALAEHGADKFEMTIIALYDDQSEPDYAEVHTISQMGRR